jgi:hypothetical protein
MTADATLVALVAEDVELLGEALVDIGAEVDVGAGLDAEHRGRDDLDLVGLRRRRIEAIDQRFARRSAIGPASAEQQQRSHKLPHQGPLVAANDPSVADEDQLRIGDRALISPLVARDAQPRDRSAR